MATGCSLYQKSDRIAHGDRPKPHPHSRSRRQRLSGGRRVRFLLAWAACCVLPLVLSIAGVSFAGVTVFAGARHWLTPIAAVVLAAGWLLHWRRSRMCRRDTACGRPSPLAFWLLVIATLLIVLSLAWEPFVEPWLLPQLAAVK